jgi:hypothetical protein
MEIEDYIAEQKAQEEMDRLLIEDYIEEQNAQDALAELEIQDYIEEQNAQDALTEMEIQDYIEEQKAQYVLEPTDEEIERNTQQLLKNLRRNKNNSTEDKNGKN